MLKCLIIAYIEKVLMLFVTPSDLISHVQINFSNLLSHVKYSASNWLFICQLCVFSFSCGSFPSFLYDPVAPSYSKQPPKPLQSWELLQHSRSKAFSYTSAQACLSDITSVIHSSELLTISYIGI